MSGSGAEKRVGHQVSLRKAVDPDCLKASSA
jgi:hypothetical protein